MNKILIVLLIVWSSIIQAKEFTYEGKVKGMVCAFCVYSVSKKIAQLPQIDPQTVNVDLKSKLINFRSSSKVSFENLAKVFSDSGFKLSELNEVKKTTLKMPSYQAKPVIEFKLDNLDIKKYLLVFESIGEIAAATKAKLVIKGPQSVETAILKPMIGGKQKITRVQYQFEKNKNNVEIKLFLKK